MSFSLATLTFVHVALSLVGIGSGFAVLTGLLARKRFDRWTAVFLASTVATSASGFLFPVDRFLPSHAVGLLSLAVLAVALAARYRYRLAGGWRTAYVASALSAFYLNFFVLIVQAFLKVPGLKSLAPTQTESPFVIAQLVALASFVGIGILAVSKFRGETAPVSVETTNQSWNLAPR